MATREGYQVSASDLAGTLMRLNRVLASISDRLDKLEGLRDTLETNDAEVTGELSVTGSSVVIDENGVAIHSMS